MFDFRNARITNHPTVKYTYEKKKGLISSQRDSATVICQNPVLYNFSNVSNKTQNAKLCTSVPAPVKHR